MTRIFTFSVALGALLFMSFMGIAQDEPKLQVGADLMSRYVWRGVSLGGNSPSIQPWIKYDIKGETSPHALTIGSWGAYTFSQTSNQEVDLYLTYSFKDMISLTVTDYFFPELFSTPDRSNYLNFSKDSTCHLFEGIVSFNGTDRIPFTLLFAMNFYGNDALRLNNDGSAKGIFMSKYIELGYGKSIGDVDLNVFIGAALDKPKTDIGEVGFYGNQSAGIINLGLKASKAIKINDNFSLPIQASFIVNPEAKNVFFVFGISL
jgi:hypothetical protein